jgi:outer membrane protein OmpA-like peptidoglycan-associated protein
MKRILLITVITLSCFTLIGQQKISKSSPDTTSLKSKDKPILNVELNKQKPDTVILKNVNFDFNSFDLHPKEDTVLKTLLDYFNDNPEFRILIYGHTDDRGSQEYNLELSVKRAKSVYNWLINNGIDSRRLRFEGFGKTHPLYKEPVEKYRALNRRVEVVPDTTDNKFGELIMKLPFGAKLYKNNLTDAQKVLDNFKRLNKGKGIFIDIWATWCRPCLDAMPNNKRLYIETKNLPVEFIFICTDFRTNMDDWITKVSILKQPGTHIFMADPIIYDMLKLLPSWGGFPTYLFIDSTGKFIPGAIPLNESVTTDRLSRMLK